jgi:hypothetical protein
VTTPGRPLNINLYQSIKCIIAAAPVVADDGVIVAYSECAEGVGSVDMLRPYENARNAGDVIDFLLKNYEIQMDHSLLQSRTPAGVRVVLVAPNVATRRETDGADSRAFARRRKPQRCGPGRGRKQVSFFRVAALPAGSVGGTHIAGSREAEESVSGAS